MSAAWRIVMFLTLANALVGCAANPAAPLRPTDSALATTVSGEAAGPTPVMLSDAPTPTPGPAAAAPARTVLAADLAEGVGEATDVEAVGGPQAAGGGAANAAIAIAGESAPGPLGAPASSEEPQVAPPAGGVAAVPEAVAPEGAAGWAAPQPAARPPAPPAPEGGLSRLVTGDEASRPEVALTFDAGADRGNAEAILDLLAAEDIHATFGMTGPWAVANPDLIQRMVAEGHQLINHNWSHSSLTGVNGGAGPLTFWQLSDELARTEQAVLDLTGYQMMPYFRPPYGDYDATTLGWLFDLGYPFTIMWSCDSKAWAGLSGPEIVDRCVSLMPDRGIILMHLGSDAAGDLEALPLLIDYYRERGSALVTVEQMLQP